MDPKEYQRRFEVLFKRFNEAHLFFFTWRVLQKKEYEKYWKQESNFWNAVHASLNQSWMMSLAKIYEKSSYSKEDTIISIYSLVKYQSDSERKKEVESFLDENKKVLNNIGIIRHHILAHTNAEHKLTRKELFEKFPIKYGEIEKLFEKTEELFHLLHHQSNHSLSMEGFHEECETDVESLMQKLEFFRKAEKKHFEKIKNGESYSDFPPE